MRVNLRVETRAAMNKTGLKQLRLSGRIPAIVFGTGEDNMMIQLSAKEFGKWARNGKGGILELRFDDREPLPVLLESVQRDPITREYIHIDFLRININEVVRTRVNLDYIGTAKGAKLGGVVQIQSTFIEIESFPDRIPATIPVEISELEIGNSLHVGDLKLPEGVVPISSANELLVSVVTPKVQSEQPEAM
ncbi:50S ribosomal protein L25 [Paenibacillus sp. GM2FR]|uniref:50S ribosomal protein L25 n=1 Tax=Paenibacillus TaxID=44249 RepID=UPI000C27E819|nr:MULTISPECIES: 50S ribosomal protein L25 [Paenibacillus]MEC0259228.1 50S ribosomal protein L25 [Paenibacillus lautus]MEC0305413.1 50S ribosomal protein L25 [Paenibacillus lautus]PJN50478.1 50S ribosomal protein L25 [Paenibacillus sp. GM2FR]